MIGREDSPFKEVGFTVVRVRARGWTLAAIRHTTME
jgi:hypothetical protein